MAPLSQHRADVRPSFACAFVVLALVAGAQASCSAGVGEDSASCSSGDDRDGDSLAGCNDSDCHQFELCRRTSSPLTPDDAGAAGADAGQAGNAGTGTVVGGMSGGAMSGGNGGEGGSIAEDGGMAPDASALCSCSADEMCSDGGCVPMAPPEQLYTVRMVSAQSPKGTLGPPPDGVCVEFACRSGGGSPVSYCPCEPEPYVRVIHISQATQPDPRESIALLTKIQGAMLSVTFESDEQADIALKPGDALRFELWDQNMTIADSLIYSCEPDLHELTSGPLDCSALSGPLGIEEFWIHATLEKL